MLLTTYTVNPQEESKRCPSSICCGGTSSLERGLFLLVSSSTVVLSVAPCLMLLPCDAYRYERKHYPSTVVPIYLLFGTDNRQHQGNKRTSKNITSECRKRGAIMIIVPGNGTWRVKEQRQTNDRDNHHQISRPLSVVVDVVSP